MNKYNLYRLSALMYPDNNGNVNRSKTIKKIIETYFVINNNQPTSLESLPSLIQEQFHFCFSGIELNKVISELDGFVSAFNGGYNKSDDIKDCNIMLTEQRYQYLCDRVSQNNIYVYIESFYKDTIDGIQDISLEYVIDLIESFLYNVFIQNIEESKYLFSHDIDISSFIKTQGFNDDGKKLINSFLDYNSEEKNKAIFDIGSLAIEYITINGDVNLSGQLNNLTSKVLYLDTNILFRLLGINGDSRSKRMYDFLKKCSEIGQELRISYVTNNEFDNALEWSLKKLEPISNKVMYTKPLDDDIITHYFDIKKNGKAMNIDLYKHMIKNRLDALISDLKINIELNDFYSSAKGKERIEMDQLRDELKVSKEVSTYQAMADAVNIYYINQLRNNQDTNFNESKYFLVTTDKKLSEWDNNNSKNVPISVFPSYWLSIILKYVTRSSDDYKSFVSFIKSVIHENHNTQEKTLAILDGISDITDKLETQTYIYDTFVSGQFTPFRGITNYNEVYEKAREVTSSILQEQIDTLAKDAKIKSKVMEEQAIQISKLEIASAKDTEGRNKEKENIFSMLKKKILKEYIFEVVLLFIVLILCAISVVMNFFFQKVDLNYMVIVSDWLYDSNDKRLQAIADWFVMLPIGAIGPVLYNLFTNLFGKRTYNNRVLDIKSKVNN